MPRGFYNGMFYGTDGVDGGQFVRWLVNNLLFILYTDLRNVCTEL